MTDQRTPPAKQPSRNQLKKLSTCACSWTNAAILLAKNRLHRAKDSRPSSAKRFALQAVSCLCLAILSDVSAAQPVGDVAVVVHPEVPVDNLSFAEVRKLLLGDRQFWAPNLRVTLLIRAPVAREREIVLKTVYQMTEAQFRQYWIAKVFRADVPAGPKVVYSNEMATELVQLLPGSIAFVSAAQVPSTLKILRVDGRLPGEKGYPLH